MYYLGLNDISVYRERVYHVILYDSGLNDISVYTEGEEVSPSNPFLKPQQSENSLLDIAMQVLSTVTARKAPRKFDQHLVSTERKNKTTAA